MGATETVNTLNVDDPAVTDFLKAWHEAERADFDAWHHTNLVYDDYYPKTAKARKKYLALDKGNEHNRSGVYLVDRATSEVYSIKAYGVPNRRLGTLADLTASFWERRATAPTPLSAAKETQP